MKHFTIIFCLLLWTVNTNAIAANFNSLYKISGHITCIGKGYFQISEITDFDQSNDTFYILDNSKKTIFFYDIKKSRVRYEKKLLPVEYINLFICPVNEKRLLIFSNGFNFFDLNIENKKLTKHTANFKFNNVIFFKKKIIAESIEGKCYVMNSELNFESKINSSKNHDDMIYLFSNENFNFYLFKKSNGSELKVYNSKTTWWKTFRTYDPVDTNIILKKHSFIKKIRSEYKIMILSPTVQNTMVFNYLIEDNDIKSALKFAKKNNLSITDGLSNRLKEKITLSKDSKQTVHLYKKYGLNNNFTDLKKKQAESKKYLFEKYTKGLSIIVLFLVFIVFMIKPF
ncbi:hypothetical protein KAJ27_05295 [bacterium]|nr:hypothetical protein [bacterium]